jgi:Holliday junction resolvasome RuvABC endonuclease subunit
MSVFFVGIDPGITNIGVCVVGGDPVQVIVSDVFSIKRGLETVEDIYLNPNYYIAKVKEELHTRIFSKLATIAANAQVFAVIEEQLQCSYAMIAAWLAVALAEVGIQTQVHKCQRVRAALGIPAKGRSLTLKKNVLLYSNCAGFVTDNHHIGDAFTLAMYCRKVVAKLEGKLADAPTWHKEPAVVSNTTTTTAKSIQLKKEAGSNAAKRKRNKPASKKAKVSKISKRQKKMKVTSTSHG